jgi:molybdenum cofactor cytidylyltransferase
MPLIDTALLVCLLDQPPPAAVRYPGGRPGVPALFARSAFAALRQLSGDQGAGPLLAGSRDLRLIDCSPDALLDVDRRSDLPRLVARLEERAATA